jgi:hypothetical protein
MTVVQTFDNIVMHSTRSSNYHHHLCENKCSNIINYVEYICK